MKFSAHRSLRLLLAAAFLTGGMSAMALPLLAQTAQIGDQIKNTFYGTFEDSKGSKVDFNGKPYESTSNEVVLKVVEVAGLTVKAQAPSKSNPDGGETVDACFVITNVGNDPTRVFIPGKAQLVNPPGGTSKDSFSTGTLQILEFNGVALATPINVPANGEETGKIAGLAGSGSLEAGKTIKVCAKVTAISGVAKKNDSVVVTLGNTGATNDQQNLPYTPDANSIYTLDNPDGTANEAAGAPVNGEREAMDSSQVIVVGAQLQSFATILLARDYSNGGTPGNITDDRITYNLAARIEKTAPAGITGVVPTDLHPTAIQLDGSGVTRVLIADAIPDGTQLSATLPQVSTNGTWKTVYTTSSLAIPFNEAAWVSTPPPLDQVTRIGYVSDQLVPVGESVTGFSFEVQPKATFAGGRVVNIAQLIGQSQPGAIVPGTPTQLVYDESGDQDPNDGLGVANPDPKSAGGTSEALGGIMARGADLALDGVDPGKGKNPLAADTNQGVNTGTTAGTKVAGGETVAQVIAVAPINGPQAQAGATGPNNTEDDFTNLVMPTPNDFDPTQMLTDAQTPPVTFTNTVQNTGPIPQDIALQPVTPTVLTALPDGTKVTITDPLSGNSAIYLYSAATGFTFSTGQGTSATAPVTLKLGTGAANTGNYTVTVDLPQAKPVQDYPVPIFAFVDQGPVGLDDGDPGNLTIDRIYTGYIRVSKEARILEADGIEVVGFTTDQARLSEATKVDRLVEYRLTYTNMSTDPIKGKGNVSLPATAFVIRDDGTEAPNNWFTTTKDIEYPAKGVGSAVSTYGNITVTANSSASDSPTDIQTYTVTIDNLNPGESGMLTFRRQIRQ
jgi:hypothetical protein